MTTYQFVEGKPEVNFVENFERSLFHDYKHLSLQASLGWLEFYILNTNKRQYEAFFPICIESNIACSPYRSPFGSIVFSESLSPKLLFDFLLFVENQLMKIGVKQIFIQNPPLVYQSKNLSLLQTLLINNKYVVAKAEIASVIRVDLDSFYSKVTSRQQQRLNNAKAYGLGFEILDLDNFREVYLRISEWQSAKGFSLSMSLNELVRVVQAFPDRFILTSVNYNQKPVAAAISIKVTDSILYNFYLSHHLDYNHLSPALFLLEGLYSFCQQQNITLLDLGTSSSQGIPNFTLLDFKRRVGSEYSSKFAFLKVLEE